MSKYRELIVVIWAIAIALSAAGLMTAIAIYH